MIPSWLWIAFTLAASALQTARNALQRDLTASLGAQGATYVRFLFGLPFACVFLIAWRLALGVEMPTPDASALLWAISGSVTQMAATALMLTAMRARSFLVTIAYTKTEPVLVALFSIAFLRETPATLTIFAIVIATIGVLVMSWPWSGESEAKKDWRPLAIGLASAACFGLSATSYRGCILALHSPSFIMTATVTLALGLAIQCALIVAWLLAFDRKLLTAIARQWRPSLFAGMLGASASQFWYLAFAISTATRVRTLALVEVPMAHVVSQKYLKQGMSRADIVGTALIVVGVLILIYA